MRSRPIRVVRRTATTLAPSWPGNSRKGEISATDRLLSTVPRPQQAAARTSAATCRGAAMPRTTRPTSPALGRLRGLDQGAVHPLGDRVGRDDLDVGQADGPKAVAELAERQGA